MPMAGPIPAPRFGEGRVFKLDMGIELSPRKQTIANRAASTAKADRARANLISSLHKGKWMTADDISRSAKITARRVTAAMRKLVIDEIVDSEKRLINERYRYVWRLK